MLQPLLPISLAVLLGSIPLATCASSPKAFNWDPSGYWEGNDGWWSTFYIRVGTPEKYVRVLPSTNWQETFVVLPQACPDSLTPDDSTRIINPDGDPVLCSDTRGLVADVNASTSWFPHPPFAKLDLDPTLVRDPPNANGLYGQDKLGLTIKDTGLTLNKQVIAGLVTPDWWIGVFGLSNLSTNFDGFNSAQTSFLQTAYDQGHIPSLSWGYQAGAHYQLKQVPATVTFGGYDRSRFAPGKLTTFGNSYQAFTLRGISYETDADKPYDLLDKDEVDKTAVLDSSIAFMYLPNKTITAVAKAFNLTYNETLQLYPLTDEQHDNLKQLNPSFTFSISDNTTSEVVKIKVPYAAFDLKVGQGYLKENKTSYYFPIRPATKESGTILGRAFMQECYVFTDYHRGEWGLAQAVWKESYDTDIVTVLTPGNSTDTGGKTNTGAIAGGAVGGVLGLAALAGLGFLFYKKKGKTDQDKKEKDNLMPTPPFAELGGAQVNSPRYEVDGTTGGDGNNMTSPIGVGAWSNENKIEAVEIDGTSTATPLTTPATELSSAATEGYQGGNRFPPNAVVAELDGGPVHLPEMEGSTPRNEEKGFRFGRPDMPTPPPPPGPPPPGNPPPPPSSENQNRFSYSRD